MLGADAMGPQKKAKMSNSKSDLNETTSKKIKKDIAMKSYIFF